MRQVEITAVIVKNVDERDGHIQRLHLLTQKAEQGWRLVAAHSVGTHNCDAHMYFERALTQQ